MTVFRLLLFWGDRETIFKQTRSLFEDCRASIRKTVVRGLYSYSLQRVVDYCCVLPMSEFWATSLTVSFTWSVSNETQIKKINRKLPFQGNSKQIAQFHTKNILGKNKQTNKQNKTKKTHEKTWFMGTPRYQLQKLTESYRFKETQKILLSFRQTNILGKNKQTNKTEQVKKRGFWALLDITSKHLQGIPLIQGYPAYSKGYITGLNIQA